MPETFYPYSIVGPHGKILGTGTANMIPPIEGHLIPVQAPPKHYWDHSAFQPIGEPPGAFHTWDWPSHEWVDLRTFPEVKEQILASVANHRWQLETSGIDLPGGIHVLTGKADQDRITSVIVNAEIAGIAEIEFKAASGWVTMSIPELRGVATAIALHVQACFSAERMHSEAVASIESIEALHSYDFRAGWPQPSEITQ